MALALDVGDRRVASAPAGSAVRSPDKTWRSVAAGFSVAAVVYLVALLVHGSTESTYRIGSDWSAFAGLFVLALAIERALEPFTKYLGPDTEELEQNRNDQLAQDDANGTASAQADVHRGRKLTAIVVWGVATALGFALSSALNITLLQAIRGEGSGQPPFWADLLVTGLVVGAGTKPLHDLITNLEKKKENQKDPEAVHTG
jgi:hypothetical protein